MEGVNRNTDLLRIYSHYHKTYYHSESVRQATISGRFSWNIRDNRTTIIAIDNQYANEYNIAHH